jgi:hypothetical protein
MKKPDGAARSTAATVRRVMNGPCERPLHAPDPHQQLLEHGDELLAPLRRDEPTLDPSFLDDDAPVLSREQRRRRVGHHLDLGDYLLRDDRRRFVGRRIRAPGFPWQVPR